MPTVVQVAVETVVQLVFQARRARPSTRQGGGGQVALSSMAA